MTGSYRMLRVMTLGSSGKHVSEWSLELRPTPGGQDSAWRRRWNSPQNQFAFPVVGQMRLLREGDLRPDGGLTGSGWGPALDSVRIRYHPASGSVRLEGAPLDVTDAGTFYPVVGLPDSGGFRGTWSDAGFALTIITTEVGKLVEKTEGYFCAYRRQERR